MTNVHQAKTGTVWLRLFWGRRPVWTAARIFVLITASLVLFKWFLHPVRITGKSMEPTFYDGQVAFINSLAYVWHPPRRGDVIGFRLEKSGQIIIKRVIGLPGERVALHIGTTFINGKSISEPYLVAKGAWEWPEETVGQNTYFVTGDNRLVSQQFRVEAGRILGRIYKWHP
jgi:signal peptidase I